jgi:hypothetical protein
MVRLIERAPVKQAARTFNYCFMPHSVEARSRSTSCSRLNTYVMEYPEHKANALLNLYIKFLEGTITSSDAKSLGSTAILSIGEQFLEANQSHIISSINSRTETTYWYKDRMLGELLPRIYALAQLAVKREKIPGIETNKLKELQAHLLNLFNKAAGNEKDAYAPNIVEELLRYDLATEAVEFAHKEISELKNEGAMSIREKCAFSIVDHQIANHRPEDALETIALIADGDITVQKVFDYCCASGNPLIAARALRIIKDQERISWNEKQFQKMFGIEAERNNNIIDQRDAEFLGLKFNT